MIVLLVFSDELKKNRLNTLPHYSVPLTIPIVLALGKYFCIEHLLLYSSVSIFDDLSFFSGNLKIAVPNLYQTIILVLFACMLIDVATEGHVLNYV